MCVTLIGTPINSYEQNEAFFPFIFYFLKLKLKFKVFMNFQAVIHDLLFHWEINMRWHRGHIPLFMHQHGKDGNKKIATCLTMPISTIRAILKRFKATGTVINLPGRGPMFILHSEEEGKRGIKFPKNHCWKITEECSILGSSRLQNYH